MVFVPPGAYSLTHTLNWTAKSSGTLFLSRGASLRTVSDRSKLYLVPHSSYYFLEPLLLLRGAVDVAIRGRGSLDANGFALMGRKKGGGDHPSEESQTWAYRRRCLTSDYR